MTAVRFSGSGLEHSPPLRGAKAQLAQSGSAAAPRPSSGRYQVMTTVPENWIPFVPVHVDGDNREVQLQRSAWMQGPAMERKHGVDWPGVPEPAR